MRSMAMILGVLVAVIFGGCRHAPGPVDTGGSSFRVMEPRPVSPPKGTGEVVEPTNQADYREAEAIHPLVMPVYPRRALLAKAGAATVGVHVTVDAKGAVTDIRPSLLAVSILPPGYEADFRDAVETAVRQWKFRPARVRHFETVIEKDFAYQRLARTETIEAEFDLAFTFTPSGKVEAGKGTEDR